ncbi:MAG: 50S ribosomal protein L11 methyltransferase [Clostridiales bacterium]|jgi:ribosomal protein L11 methyltransferase|nr:50S ribosomal protein L11 methyltransferase [Clostridiales bacterium]
MDGWIQIKVTVKQEYLNDLCAVMSMVDNSLMVEDYSDVQQELDGVYGDLIDQELLERDRTIAAVSVFIPMEKSPAESEGFIRERLSVLDIPAEIECIGVHEEDWANSWKQYYKPIKTGEKLVIVPEWETYDPASGEIVVLMDPGMAFGTGTHETTRLCAMLLEKYVRPGDRMLDVGCGSGILAICAAKLGAGSCFACDIDPVAVRIAGENAALNQTAQVETGVSDLLAQAKKAPGGYHVCCANIVADVIIRLSPDIGGFMEPDGVLIVSGIITERAEETVSALKAAGWHLIDERRENGWFAGALKRNG